MLPGAEHSRRGIDSGGCPSIVKGIPEATEETKTRCGGSPGGDRELEDKKEHEGKGRTARHGCLKAGPRNRLFDSTWGLGSTRSLMELRMRGH